MQVEEILSIHLLCFFSDAALKFVVLFLFKQKFFLRNCRQGMGMCFSVDPWEPVDVGGAIPLGSC